MTHIKVTLTWVLITASVVIGACTSGWDQKIQEYPWLVKPLRNDTKRYFCQKLGLPDNHFICQPDRKVLAKDLLAALKERFPVHQTTYADVAKVLDGYPVEADLSRYIDGTITGKRYVYLITEFDGYCAYFQVNLDESEVVTRITSSGIEDGSPTVCGSLALRKEPRVFLTDSTPTP